MYIFSLLFSCFSSVKYASRKINERVLVDGWMVGSKVHATTKNVFEWNKKHQCWGNSKFLRKKKTEILSNYVFFSNFESMSYDFQTTHTKINL